MVGKHLRAGTAGLDGASPEVVAYGSGYTRVLLGGNIVIIMLFLVNAIFRGAGDGAIAMRALWLANGINILLCPCFIMGLGPFPELGVMGASVATTIGRGTGALYVLSRLFQWQRSGQAESFASQSEHERDGHFGEAVFERHVSGLHRHGELDRLDEDSFKLRQHGDRGIHDRHPNHLVRALSSFGMSNAAATMVGQALGAGKPDRAEKAVWLTRFLQYVLSGRDRSVLRRVLTPGW